MLHRTLSLLALALLVVGCGSTAPANVPQPGTDEFEISSTVLASYNVVSGPAGRRDWKRFNDLFTEGGQVFVGGAAMTPDAFGKSVNEALQSVGLFEHPVETRIERFRDTAQVWTVYESRHAATDEQPYARGARGFQLLRSGERWRIASMVMQPEDAAHPLPMR
jgi:SnoaL-like protein